MVAKSGTTLTAAMLQAHQRKMDEAEARTVRHARAFIARSTQCALGQQEGAGVHAEHPAPSLIGLLFLTGKAVKHRPTQLASWAAEITLLSRRG